MSGGKGGSNGNSSGSGNSSTVTSANPIAQSAYQQALNMASNAASTPYQAYTGQLVAPQNATQTQAYTQVAGLQGATIPYYNAANQNFTNATNNVSNGVQAANASNIAQYENPYQQQVINATQAQLNQNDAVQSQQQTGNAISAGAFGGDREAASQALLANQQDLANNQTIAGLNSQNYSQALGQLNTENQQQISENEANNQNALNAGTAQEGLGTSTLNSGLQGANALLQTGNQQQQQQQAVDTANYQQWENALAFPYQQAGFYANIAEGLGSQMGGTSNTNQAENSGYNSSNWNLSLARGGKVRKGLAAGGNTDDNGDPLPVNNNASIVANMDPDTQEALLSSAGPEAKASALYAAAKAAPVHDNIGSPDVPPQYLGASDASAAPSNDNSDSDSDSGGVIKGLGNLAGRFIGPSNAHTSSGYSVDPGMSIAKGLIAGLAGPTPNPLLNLAFGAMYGLNDYGKQQQFVEKANNDSNNLNARDQEIDDTDVKNQNAAEIEQKKLDQAFSAQQLEQQYRDWEMKHGDEALSIQQQAANRKGIIPVQTPSGTVLYDLDKNQVIQAPGLPGTPTTNSNLPPKLADIFSQNQLGAPSIPTKDDLKDNDAEYQKAMKANDAAISAANDAARIAPALKNYWSGTGSTTRADLDAILPESLQSQGAINTQEINKISGSLAQQSVANAGSSRMGIGMERFAKSTTIDPKNTPSANQFIVQNIEDMPYVTKANADLMAATKNLPAEHRQAVIDQFYQENPAFTNSAVDKNGNPITDKDGTPLNGLNPVYKTPNFVNNWIHSGQSNNSNVKSFPQSNSQKIFYYDTTGQRKQ